MVLLNHENMTHPRDVFTSCDDKKWQKQTRFLEQGVQNDRIGLEHTAFKAIKDAETGAHSKHHPLIIVNHERRSHPLGPC